MDRLERLERSVRMWKWSTIAVAGVGFLAGAAQQAATQAELTQLKIVDERGQQRIRLDPNWGGNGPAVVIFDKNGKVAGTFQKWDEIDSAGVFLYGEGQGKACLQLMSDGAQGVLNVTNPKGGRAQFAARGTVSF